MIVLDACALVAFLLDESAATAVSRLLKGDDPVAITAVNLGEAVDQIGRRNELSAEKVRSLIGAAMQGVIEVLPVTESMIYEAADLRIRYYHRKSCPVSLSDCIALAACEDGDRLATLDVPMLDVAKQESIDSIKLPRP